MKTTLLSISALACGAFAWALEGGDIDRWVRELASEDPKTRDAAVEHLQKAGEAARPALEAAAKSDDPEVAMQAQKLLRRLDAGPQPAPPPEPEPAPRKRIRIPARGGSTRVILNLNGSTTTIQEDPSGKVTVKEQAPGQEDRVFEADSREAFVEKHPEVAKKYGLDKDRGGFSFGPGTREADELAKELEKALEQMRKALDRDRKGWDPEKDMEEFEEQLRKALGEHRDPRRGGAAGRLGVVVGPVDEALRYQLELPEGGVLIAEVAPGTRAEQLGLRQYDILLTLNGCKIGSADDIRNALPDDGPLSAEIIREGERTTLQGK
jgi:hypothetical protein